MNEGILGETVTVALRPSRHLAAGLAVIHLASASLVLFLELPWSIAGLFVATVAAHGWWSIQRVAWLARATSTVQITLQRDHRCALRRGDGHACVGTVDDSTLVTGWLVVLVVSTAGIAKRRVVVCQDMLDADDFRRLRIALRWGHSAQPAGELQA